MNYIKIHHVDFTTHKSFEQLKAEENFIKKVFKQFIVYVDSDCYKYQYILYIHPNSHQVYIHREAICIINGMTIKLCPSSFEIQNILDEQNIEPKEGMKLFVVVDTVNKFKFKKCEYFQFCEQILNESDFE